MSKAPIVYRSTHWIKFSELDPYDHVRTGTYAMVRITAAAGRLGS
jgi:acyl-CoA thioester hydrolase